MTIADATRPAAKRPPALVVVGNGMARFGLLKQLAERRARQLFRIVVCDEEPRPAYDRANLSQCFDGTSPEQLELAQRAWYADHGAELPTDLPRTT